MVNHMLHDKKKQKKPCLLYIHDSQYTHTQAEGVYILLKRWQADCEAHTQGRIKDL